MIKTILPLLFIFIICSCKDTVVEKQVKCPYTKIEWSNSEKFIKKKSEYRFTGKIDVAIEGKLKKIIDAGGNGDLTGEVKNLSDEVNKLSNSVDQEFADKWNTLVEDICGKWVVINSNVLNDSLEEKTKNDLYNRIRMFYDLLYPEPNNGKVQQIKKKERLEIPKKIEISIQLEKKSKGFKSVFIDGQKALVLAESTKYNPRILVSSNPKINQKILILLTNGDTCYIDKTFDISRSDEFPIRFIPNCNL